MNKSENFFDIHNWKPEFFDSAQKINDAIRLFNLKSKKIKAVHTIGVAQNLDSWSCESLLRRTLADVGVPYVDIDNGIYPYIDDTLLEREVEICEPVVFVFDDNTTFEVMPNGKDGLWMSVNQISSQILDGTNHHNYDSELFFHKLKGKSIEGMRVIESKYTCDYGQSSYIEVNTKVRYQFKLDGKFGFCFEQDVEGWFVFGVTNQYHYCLYGNEIDSITYREIKKAVNNIVQVEIVEGHDCGGYFWIMPVKHDQVGNESPLGMIEYRDEEISIEELDVETFLYFFLEKYYDKNYDYKNTRDKYTDNSFQWNLEYNIYTYDTVKAMLDDIERCAVLLKEDYYNPLLDELKKKFSVYDFVPDLLRSEKKFSDTDKDRIIRDNIDVATDFYHRFVKRIRLMMEHSTDYDLISFMGP